MTTPNQQLLSMLDPQQARLLDQQMRDQQVAQRAQGGGMLSGIVQAYTGMGDLAQRALGSSPVGVNQQAAIKAQQQQKVLSNAISSAEGKTQSERLFNAAEKLESSGNPQAIMKAMQLREQAASLAMQEQRLDLEQQRIDATEAQNKTANKLAKSRIAVQERANELAASPKVTSTGNIYDSENNLFKEIVYKNGKREVIPVGNSPEKPIGEVKTAQEVNSDNILNRQVNVANHKQWQQDRNTAAAEYQEASKGFRSANKVLELVEKAKDDTGGYVNVKIAEAKKLLGFNADDDITVQELDKALKADMLANLKATFGGSQITDSERNFLERTMPSLMDSPEVIRRKAEANRAMQKRIMDRTLSLSKTKNYTEYIATETEHFQSDYDKMMEEYSEFTGSGTGGVGGELTQDQILVREEITRRQAQTKQNERRNRRGSGANATTN